MRHRVAHRKLGRVTEHRLALLRNQAEALLRHERIDTTVAKAKELRPFVERLITIAKRGLAVEGGDVTLHARRLVLRDVQDRVVVSKLFDSIAPRFVSRNGGYTRLLRIGHRRGDNTEMAQVELIGSEFSATENTEDASDEDVVKSDVTKKATGKGVGDRLRKAASRIRGKKSKETEPA
jgi:large subunit ribosomal protein L17